MLTIVFLFVCYVSVFIITVLLCLLLLCMLFLICMVLNICNSIQRTEQVPVELDISAIEEYILLLFKTALNKNIIPHTWKLANIVPIPKPNKDTDKGTSYRPISLLSVIQRHWRRAFFLTKQQTYQTHPCNTGTKHNTLQ